MTDAYVNGGGSSPLARGTPRWLCAGDNHQRFIPAGAGNTCSYSASIRVPTVHPRWRGEHALLIARPRSFARFIPAGAGNTPQTTQHPKEPPVHPRWRGEHVANRWLRRSVIGSSPLARGTPLADSKRLKQVRFIPAGAGNTFCRMAHWITSPVHPRWRGEHGSNMQSRAWPSGSSPLARGTLASGGGGLLRGRFIPAGAGNTLCRRQCLGRGTVHPRWRGEHADVLEKLTGAGGSSPLARGTLYPQRSFQALWRFIPAGAGNTGSCAVP